MFCRPIFIESVLSCADHNFYKMAFKIKKKFLSDLSLGAQSIQKNTKSFIDSGSSLTCSPQVSGC